jgi:hypothetical protein
MEKQINIGKFQPLLIYPENVSFLKSETKLPHSSNEIMNNFRTRMGGTIAFEQNPVQGTVLYGGIFMICILIWIAIVIITIHYKLLEEIDSATIRLAAPAMPILAGLAAFTWFMAQTLFTLLRYSPTKMRESYALLLHQGKLIKGTIVSAKFFSGVHIITYQFANPTGQTVRCIYRSPRLKYNKKEKLNGKNVVVWYLNDTINTLL